MARADKWMEPYGNPVDVITKMPIKGDPVTAIAGVASVGSALIGSNSAEDATNEATGISEEALRKAQELADAQKIANNKAMKPYVSVGNKSSYKLADYLGLDMPSSAYSSAQSEYNRAKQELERLLTPQAVTTSNPNQDSQFIYRGADWEKVGQDLPQTTQTTQTDPALIAEARRRLKAAEAAMNGVDKFNPRSENFGSLLDNFDNEDFVRDPGYEFRLAEGEKGIDRASAARGGYDSGSTLKALARYNQDYASNEFDAAYGRDANNKNRIYSFLSGTADRGLNAASNKSSLNTGLTSNITSGILGTGANQAGYAMEGGAAQNNAIQSGIGNLLYAQRTQNAPVLSTPPITPQYGSSSGTPWYLS